MPSTPEDVERFLRERHPHAAELALAVRERVVRAEPDLEERVYPGWNRIGFRHPDGGLICGIYPQPGGEVRLLFEHGTRIGDPDGRLEGEGRQTRHLTVAQSADGRALGIGGYVSRAGAGRRFRAR